METNKLYEKFRKFIKENFGAIIFLVVCILLATVRLDYEIYTPGGLSNLNKRINVQDGYDSEGSFNLTYVSSKRGTIPAILLSYIIPSWDLVSIDDVRIDEDENYEDILERGKIDLESVNENAIVVAFEAASLDYQIVKNEPKVYYILEGAKTNLKIGDVIDNVNGVKVTDLKDISKTYEGKKSGDKISIEVIRDGKKRECYATLYEEDGKVLIGIMIVNVIEVKTDKDITFNYNGNESGASGGLMSSLEIYNRITEFDLTKGRVIAGTGSLSLDGTVGEIGGVKYKLAGAVKKGAEIFIVPTENYEEAVKLKKEKGYDIEIIEADNFKNVVEKLMEM